MKEKLTRNLGTTILSFFLSVILWLMITNLEDPVVPREFKDVPVTLLNRRVIESAQETFDITENETINFTVRARRSIRDKLTKEDFRVTANLEHLNEFDVVDIKIESLDYEDEIKITEGDDLKLSIVREKVFEDSFRVDVIEKGEVSDDYVIGDITLDHNMIFVSGPKSRVDRIDKVAVEVDVDNASGQIYRRANPKAYDEEGNEIDQLSFGPSVIYITINLFKKKEIEVDVKTSGHPAYGHAVTNVEFVPKTITIAGADEVIADIESITYTEDISRIKESVSKSIDLEEELPSGVIIVGDDKTVALNITVEKLETKSIDVMTSDIAFKNKPPGQNVYITMASPIKVKVMGLKKELGSVTKGTLKPYLDLSGYRDGTYSLELKSGFDGDISIVDTPRITVHLGNN